MSKIYVKGLKFSFLQIRETEKSDSDVTFPLHLCSHFLLCFIIPVVFSVYFYTLDPAHLRALASSVIAPCQCPLLAPPAARTLPPSHCFQTAQRKIHFPSTPDGAKYLILPFQLLCLNFCWSDSQLMGWVGQPTQPSALSRTTCPSFGHGLLAGLDWALLLRDCTETHS